MTVFSSISCSISFLCPFLGSPAVPEPHACRDTDFASAGRVISEHRNLQDMNQIFLVQNKGNKACVRVLPVLAEASTLLLQYAILFTVSVILLEIKTSSCFICLFVMFKSHEVRTKQNLEGISLLSASLVVIIFIKKKKK